MVQYHVLMESCYSAILAKIIQVVYLLIALLLTPRNVIVMYSVQRERKQDNPCFSLMSKVISKSQNTRKWRQSSVGSHPYVGSSQK